MPISFCIWRRYLTFFPVTYISGYHLATSSIYKSFQCFHGRESVGEQGGRTGMYFQPSCEGEWHSAGLRDVYFRFWSSHLKKKAFKVCVKATLQSFLWCALALCPHSRHPVNSNTPFLSLPSYLNITICYHRSFLHISSFIWRKQNLLKIVSILQSYFFLSRNSF